MNLAFVINNFRDKEFKSGGERVFYELLIRALNDGHNVQLFCANYNDFGEEKSLESKISITYLNAKSKDFKKPRKIEKIFNELRNELKNKNFDHVICENIAPYLDISIIQGHSSLKYLETEKNLFAKLLFKIKKNSMIKYQKKWLKENKGKIIVPSNILKNELSENFKIDKNNIHVIYPGIDFSDKNIKTDFNKNIVFGIAALNFTYKGGYILLGALHILKKQGYNPKIKIINDKYYKKINNPLILWQIIRFNLWENIEFISRQNDMSDFYNSIDCLIMPSLIETFGLVALEAMSYKRPCIVSSVSGASEIIKDGENGFIFDFDKNKAKNLAQKMQILLDNPEILTDLSNNAFKSIQKMNWSNFYQAFTEILKS